MKQEPQNLHVPGWIWGIASTGCSQVGFPLPSLWLFCTQNSLPPPYLLPLHAKWAGKAKKCLNCCCVCCEKHDLYPPEQSQLHSFKEQLRRELFQAASPYGLIQDSLLPRGKADALWDIRIILQIFGADLPGEKQVSWTVIFQLKVAGGVCVPWLDVIKNCAWLTWNSTNVHQKKCGSLYSNTQPGLWKLHLASTQPACRGARKRKRKKKLTAIQRGYKASVDKLLHILLPLIILNSFNESLSK